MYNVVGFAKKSISLFRPIFVGPEGGLISEIFKLHV